MRAALLPVLTKGGCFGLSARQFAEKPWFFEIQLVCVLQQNLRRLVDGNRRFVGLVCKAHLLNAVLDHYDQSFPNVDSSDSTC